LFFFPVGHNIVNLGVETSIGLACLSRLHQSLKTTKVVTSKLETSVGPELKGHNKSESSAQYSLCPATEKKLPPLLNSTVFAQEGSGGGLGPASQFTQTIFAHMTFE
jgi:hypothetical protein